MITVVLLGFILATVMGAPLAAAAIKALRLLAELRTAAAPTRYSAELTARLARNSRRSQAAKLRQFNAQHRYEI